MNDLNVEVESRELSLNEITSISGGNGADDVEHIEVTAPRIRENNGGGGGFGSIAALVFGSGSSDNLAAVGGRFPLPAAGTRPSPEEMMRDGARMMAVGTTMSAIPHPVVQGTGRIIGGVGGVLYYIGDSRQDQQP